MVLHKEKALYGGITSHRNNIVAEPEGEATNLDNQVAERLYICI